MITFGAGKLIAIPTNDSTGAAVANPTPVILGVLQDVTVDLSVELKTLYGNKRYPVAIGQGKGKTEIKAKYADINGGVLGSLFYGKVAAAGIKAAVFDFTETIPGTPFQVTIAPPSSGTFVADLGVLINGVQATRVASAPAVGQYTVSGGGVYLFNTGDATKTHSISYEYSASAGGQVFNLTNDIMGVTPSFATLLQTSYDGKSLIMKLNRCVSGKLNVPLKNDDFGMYDFEAEAFEDSAGSLGYICLTN